MSHYETPTSRARKSKRDWKRKQKAKQSQLPRDDSNNLKLSKFVPGLRRRYK